MNILFFLTPKKDVAIVEENDTLRQVLEKMEHHGYSAVPIIAKNGKYIGTITEGDILWELHRHSFPSMKQMENVPIQNVIRNRDNKAVHVATDMEGLISKALNQNFIPVVDDDNVFIGIVTRKDLIQYMSRICTSVTIKNATE